MAKDAFARNLRIMIFDDTCRRGKLNIGRTAIFKIAIKANGNAPAIDIPISSLPTNFIII